MTINKSKKQVKVMQAIIKRMSTFESNLVTDNCYRNEDEERIIEEIKTRLLDGEKFRFAIPGNYSTAKRFNLTHFTISLDDVVSEITDITGIEFSDEPFERIAKLVGDGVVNKAALLVAKDVYNNYK